MRAYQQFMLMATEVCMRSEEPIRRAIGEEKADLVAQIASAAGVFNDRVGN